MIIEGFVWLAEIIDKVEKKHNVTRFEVENLFTRKPIFSKPPHPEGWGGLLG